MNGSSQSIGCRRFAIMEEQEQQPVVSVMEDHPL